MVCTLLYDNGSVGKNENFTCSVTLSHHVVLVHYHFLFLNIG
jgi:hypothetical protein